MPRGRYGATDGRLPGAVQQKESRRGLLVEPAQKRRRVVPLGSSPPQLTTASLHLATKTRSHRHKEPEVSRASSTSPSAKRKRRIVLVQQKAALELRSSSPASPPVDDLPILGRPPTLPSAQQSEQHAASTLVRRHAQLDRSDPSSPIGTFGAQMIGRSGRPLRSSFVGPSQAASRPSGARTIGLRAFNAQPRVQAGPTGRKHLRHVAGSTEFNNENAPTHQLQRRNNDRTAKQIAEEDPARPKRRRARIQRVQFERNAPSSSAEQPLSDADHHLNSQSDAADADLLAADESEITYFPTLCPTRPSSDEVRNSTDIAEPHSTPASQRQAAIDPSSECLTDAPPTSKTDQSRPRLPDHQHVTLPPAEEDSEEGDTSVGLLELLSQSSARRFDGIHSAQTFPSRQRHLGKDAVASPRPSIRTEEQHHVQVDFDPAQFTTEQAQSIAVSVARTGARAQRWTPCDPDVMPSRVHASTGGACSSRRLLRSVRPPPSFGTVCRDLGLSSAQMLKKPLTEARDFVHRSVAGSADEGEFSNDQLLESFEHGLRFAGYRSAAKPDLHAMNEPGKLPRLKPFNTNAFQKRAQTRRKEVVKVILPFSEPSFAAGATRARFIPPQSTMVAPQSRSTVDTQDGPLLVWMQSTAHAFFRALESMMQAGFARSAQSSPSHHTDSNETDLYPCPILHYAAHATPTQSSCASKAPSHVAFYVHLDRLEEARQKLASLDLGNGEDGGYRPFSDPSVHLLVTSLRGEPLRFI